MTTDESSWSPDDVDLTQPSVARVYDYYLGGSHNFESDREFGQRAVAAYPGLPQAIRGNRSFLRRAVLHACNEGITQFLDLGSGIPTVGNVHEVAQEVESQSRVVYVDHDPVAVAHGTALLESNPRATAVRADLRSPQVVLDQAKATGLIDLDRPVALLLIAVVHFMQDDEEPGALIAEYMDALVPGSLLALSHARSDGPPELVEAARVYDRAGSPGRMRLRTRSEVEALFGDLTILEPGVVGMPEWRRDLTGDQASPAGGTSSRTELGESRAGLAGMGRRD